MGQGGSCCDNAPHRRVSEVPSLPGVRYPVGVAESAARPALVSKNPSTEVSAGLAKRNCEFSSTTPPGASWHNQVEGLFGILTKQSLATPSTSRANSGYANMLERISATVH